MLSLGSFAIGCLLLSGLFVYDVFWVFGTDVMVSVAKGINAPIKILFPKFLGVTPMQVGADAPRPPPDFPAPRARPPNQRRHTRRSSRCSGWATS